MNTNPIEAIMILLIYITGAGFFIGAVKAGLNMLDEQRKK